MDCLDMNNLYVRGKLVEIVNERTQTLSFRE